MVPAPILPASLPPGNAPESWGDDRHHPADRAAFLGHAPVLAQEALAALAPVPGGLYLDGTFGGGGHARLLLEACGPDGRVVALDRDPEAVAGGAALALEHPQRLVLLQSRFSALGTVLDRLGLAQVDGILLDLGVSSHQLDAPERGFSFRAEGPLDMRMDPRATGPTAADLVNGLAEEELARLIRELGEERFARRVARAIGHARRQSPLTTTRQLATLLERTVPRGRGGIHPATRTFQALRITVNGELEELRNGLVAALDRLRPGGRLAVICFHSLEDRMVKEVFRQGAHPQPPPHPVEMGPHGPRASRPPPATLRLITRKPLVPGPAETARNPRSRSARLRVAERLSCPGTAP
ncbi:MAG: 16S rRNA (cytosine(1402)-N(4))-methyltransferase RsmH [Magnetococcales bacterium]|nr:16S rRNA (cytosine(1402)-N(4))-methyltransferase RsmH [Magnetococcales bacterium]